MQVRPKAAEIPAEPGVYRFWDPDGRVIYVGKAKVLKNRILSYFSDPGGLHPRTAQMVDAAARVDWVVVASELEALQLEHSWINEFDPRFNVRFKDDKSYPWLAITVGEEFPRVMIYRGDRHKGVKYFGPYVQAWLVRQTIDRLLRVYPVRTCATGVFRRAKASGQPCLLGYIDKCAAPCVGKVTPAEHRELVQGFVGLLQGNTRPALTRLQSEMAEASANLEFERAAAARDAIAAVEWVVQRSAVVLPAGTDADVIGLAEDELAACVQVFQVQDGRVTGERSLLTDAGGESAEGETLGQALMSMYSAERPPPPVLMVSHLPPDAPLIETALSELRSAKVELTVPQRGPKAALLSTVVHNAQQALTLFRSRRGADIASRGNALAEIADYLEMPNAPLRIECIDVSHLDGEAVVASLVVFEDGLPLKRDYRKFVLRHGQGNNDLLSIAEVVRRRFTPQSEADAGRKFSYPPSLLLVDGGRPQVNAAAAVLAELGVDLPVAGLAKRLEEVWRPDSPDPVVFPRNSDGLFLLQRIRDESHRVAIGHQRQRIRKSRLESELEKVPGLGPTRIKQLLRKFGSVAKLREASASEISALPGFGPALAQAVQAAVAEMAPPLSVNTATGEINEGA